MKLLLLILLFVSNIFASLATETEGMETVSRGDGTFLTAGPTYVFDRPSLSDGIHASGELFSPEKLKHRLLLNRYSVTPTWNLLVPGIYMSTGNEIGDMIYQDFVTESNEANRTPLLEAGFRSPLFHGFFVTGRYFQVDHYSSKTLKEREKWVGSTSYSWFGENLPFFSTAYAGFGYKTNASETSLLVGKEYLWIYSETSRWIPVTYSPRIEGKFDYKALSAKLVFENAEFENKQKKESGSRKEVSGHFYLAANKICTQKFLQAGGGVAFRTTSSSGDVYFELEDDFVIWPFLELRLNLQKNISLGVNAGANENDFLVQDSLEFKFFPNLNTDILFGIGNRVGSSLNPLSDTYEYIEGEKINLKPGDYFQIHRTYLHVTGQVQPFTLGGALSAFAEEGAETFDTTYTEKQGNMTLRYGNVSRIKSWITSVSGEVFANFKYNDLFALEAKGGFERIKGKESRFEVNPAEAFVHFLAFWNFSNHLKFTQSLNYRSDAKWNLRTRDTLIVKGSWYLNATVEQNFPEYKFSLSGTILHILGNDKLEVPNGGIDRTRFFANIKKYF